MPQIENAPIIEAIFEIKWGNIEPNKLQFSQQEQSLFPGIFAKIASDQNYKVMEAIGGGPLLPHKITHRFRKEENKWPCLQIGLGVFTINQTGDDYDWDQFKKDIYNGLTIFQNANENNFINTLNNSTLVLRYHDAFYPDETSKMSQYIKENFNLSLELPQEFFSNDNIEQDIQHINLKFEIPLKNELGVISITLTSAIINGKAGLLLETITQCQLKDITSSGFNIDLIMDWANNTKQIQRHSFDTIVKEKAYKQELS